MYKLFISLIIYKTEQNLLCIVPIYSSNIGVLSLLNVTISIEGNTENFNSGKQVFSFLSNQKEYDRTEHLVLMTNQTESRLVHNYHEEMISTIIFLLILKETKNLIP